MPQRNVLFHLAAGNVHGTFHETFLSRPQDYHDVPDIPILWPCYTCVLTAPGFGWRCINLSCCATPNVSVPGQCVLCLSFYGCAIRAGNCETLIQPWPVIFALYTPKRAVGNTEYQRTVLMSYHAGLRCVLGRGLFRGRQRSAIHVLSSGLRPIL